MDTSMPIEALTGYIYGYYDANGFQYVGQTRDCNKRHAEHLRGRSAFGKLLRANPHIYTLEVLEEIKGVDIKDFQFNSNVQETAWMFHLHTYRPVYKRGCNLTLPGSQNYTEAWKLIPHESKVRGGQTAAKNKSGCHAPGMPIKGVRTQQERGIGIYAPDYDKSKRGRLGGLVGGKVSGRLSAESGRLASLRTSEHQSTAAKCARHIQWHVRRGVFQPKCGLCRAAQVAA